MVAANHDRRFHLAPAHQFVEGQPELGALAIAQPADARGQSLEGDTLAGQANPAVQRLIFGEELEHRFVGALDVRRVAGQRRPAERPFALAEERPNEGGHEAREVEARRRRPPRSAWPRMLLP